MAIEEDEQYNSASDEDFNPDAVSAVEDSSSDEDAAEGRTVANSSRRQGTKRSREKIEIGAELDSGDEATIRERKRRQRRKGKVDETEQSEDSTNVSSDDGGEGGFVRTRAQRRAGKIERRALASTKGATVDVDAMWARLSSMPVGRAPEPESISAEGEDDYVVIKRTTKFAGQITTEERRVLKSSKEARVWFEEQETAQRRKEPEKENKAPDAQPGNQQDIDEPSQAAPSMPLRRPLKRPFRWDPNPTGEVKGLPANLQLRWPRGRLPAATATADPNDTNIASHRALPKLPAAAKLNTVQKSKYDWATYVDENKLAEELDEYSRSKESYAGRTDFLNRLEQKREENRLAARSKLSQVRP
ncbi:uncharacterized protein PV09_03955 [Verruconis gallopava]|uniref:SWR1-complex protein 5 n=1 Tax=Verruconis gallopava TaxID=253628 RepID=A0A0D2B066_9PEZI|nr:uncharacterized protein PV09_03955 [Verruconis gallopava]KIW04764.1 hypothetical protein PV09_03955 [Verruconis gallopava]